MKLPVSEDLIHCAIADLLRFKARREVIWFHVANERECSKRLGAKLKRMGVTPGIPDFCIVLRGGQAAFLEVKSARGTLSPAQTAFREHCMNYGFFHDVVRSSQEAEEVLDNWGALRRSPAPVSQKKAA